jgi:hypothetical protein
MRRQKGTVRVIWERSEQFFPAVHVRNTPRPANCDQREGRAPHDTLATTFRSSGARQDAFTFTICHIMSASSSAKNARKGSSLGSP